MRMMCGSDLNTDTEHRMMQAFVNRIGKLGLVYFPPLSATIPSDSASAWHNARVILAMTAWHERDGNPIWIERIRKIATGIDKIAIRRYNYAYYPLESGFRPDGTWKFTDRPGGKSQSFYPYTPPDEPSLDQQGVEGSVKFDMGTTVRGLIQAYRMTGDERFVEISKKLTTWCLLPSMWNDGWEWGISGHEHGLFDGHFHGNTMALRGMLDYAIAANDERIKEILREAYEHGRRIGLARSGWFPAWITPHRFGRPEWIKRISETCGIADMVALAITLSDAGMGDYWDDVDQYVRNQLTEHQFIDEVLLASIATAAHRLPKKNIDTDLSHPMAGDTRQVVERMIGSYGGGAVTHYFDITGGGCCTGNGALGTYYAWEAITRYRDGNATVNLLLNRAAPWLDVASSLPYEGRVRITNKTARSLAVRIPGWVKMEGVRSNVAGTPAQPIATGRYLLFQGLKPQEVVELTFDQPESSDSYTIAHESFKLKFRGSTVMEATPRPEGEMIYPFYRRAHMKAGPAPLVKKQVHLAGQLLNA
jgi:hypothetical protein